jgi:hypothetical protein
MKFTLAVLFTVLPHFVYFSQAAALKLQLKIIFGRGHREDRAVHVVLLGQTTNQQQILRHNNQSQIVPSLKTVVCCSAGSVSSCMCYAVPCYSAARRTQETSTTTSF